MSAQQQWLKQFSDSDYDQLSSEVKVSVSVIFFLSMFSVVRVFIIITLINTSGGETRVLTNGSTVVMSSCKSTDECKWCTVLMLCLKHCF